MLRRRLATSTVICALPFALVACGEKAPTDPRTEAPLVRAAIVHVGTPASRSFTGTVAARVQSDLGFRVSGKVLERLVDAGQTVKRGQPLMRIDPIDLKLAAHAQQEAVAAARARAQQTAQDEARYRVLRGPGAISASAYDQSKAAADAEGFVMRPGVQWERARRSLFGLPFKFCSRRRVRITGQPGTFSCVRQTRLGQASAASVRAGSR